MFFVFFSYRFSIVEVQKDPCNACNCVQCHHKCFAVHLKNSHPIISPSHEGILIKNM